MQRLTGGGVLGQVHQSWETLKRNLERSKGSPVGQGRSKAKVAFTRVQLSLVELWSVRCPTVSVGLAFCAVSVRIGCHLSLGCGQRLHLSSISKRNVRVA